MQKLSRNLTGYKHSLSGNGFLGRQWYKFQNQTGHFMSVDSKFRGEVATTYSLLTDVLPLQSLK